MLTLPKIASKMYYIVPTKKHKLYLSFNFILYDITENFDIGKQELLEKSAIKFF